MSNSSDSESYKSLPDADDAKNSGGEEPSSNETESADAANLRRTKFTRAEKKARRMLIKQGSKPLPNVSRIVMRQAHMLFVIDEAEVYKNPKSDTFIVFGEVKIEDLSKQREQLMASNQMKAAATLAKSTALSAISTQPAVAEADDDDDEIVDDTGIDSKDIELVMSQASTTRARAIRALKENDNDIVNAIMALTM